MKYTQPKGTFDIVPKPLKEEDAWKASSKWQYVEEVITKAASDYGFSEIRTPIFEKTDLFVRSVGGSSDIVSKEMYTFEDKAGRSMSLRPEGTAPVVRAFIENHMQQLGSHHKLWYLGPYFRYDRPQAGRFRQFHQFGVEAIGRSDPYQDVEIIDFVCEIYKRLGIQNLNVLINSVGDKESRANYKNALIQFLTPHYDSLSEDSKQRFEKNPLRILDTKDETEIELLKEAPLLCDYLTPKCKKHFDEVLEILKELDISFTLAPQLVRGLDYYNMTVFEVTSSVLGAQNSIGAGGRYDGLMKDIGGQDLPSIGYATGIERILSTMQGQGCKFGEEKAPFIFFVPLGESAKKVTFKALSKLRHKQVPSEMYVKSQKMQKALQEASEQRASYAVIIGEQELEKGIFQIKNMETRDSEEVPLSSIITHLYTLWESASTENRSSALS
ncbi:histidine--tRNA ligase [Candidatus Aerophobetes bacterium]|uniref:Histidine--tRNA ligase n=1 Tax=Aerophobetes bacterium TaxID=2030807 RepID=A0A2A4YKH2_UNCAE|nr:MAG: histidine--tRNA ligase [Candidatus Aerophobetes bacterium]